MLRYCILSMCALLVSCASQRTEAPSGPIDLAKLPILNLRGLTPRTLLVSVKAAKPKPGGRAIFPSTVKIIKESLEDACIRSGVAIGPSIHRFHVSIEECPSAKKEISCVHMVGTLASPGRRLKASQIGYGLQAQRGSVSGAYQAVIKAILQSIEAQYNRSLRKR